jgi:hypothetical protein
MLRAHPHFLQLSPPLHRSERERDKEREREIEIERKREKEGGRK